MKTSIKEPMDAFMASIDPLVESLNDKLTVLTLSCQLLKQSPAIPPPKVNILDLVTSTCREISHLAKNLYNTSEIVVHEDSNCKS